MSTNQDEMTMAALPARVSELEPEIAALRAARETKSAQEVSQPRLGEASDAGDAPAAGPASRKRSSRRGLLRTAVVGAGALLGRSAGVAHANGTETPTTFTSSTSGTPAVTANGTNGAYGVVATSDSGFGVLGQGTSGPGVVGTSSSSGPALVANGPVQVQGNSVGQATLAVGATSVTVTTSAATASSNILLTPLANPKANLWVSRAAGSFTIHISKALTSNLSIAYLIIN